MGLILSRAATEATAGCDDEHGLISLVGPGIDRIMFTIKRATRRRRRATTSRGAAAIVNEEETVGKIARSIYDVEMPRLDAIAELVDRDLTEYHELGMIDVVSPDSRFSSFQPQILKPMLAKPIDELSKIPFGEHREYIYEEKYDGERMLCLVRNDTDVGSSEFYSRTLKPVRFQFKIPISSNYGNCIFDGELVFLNEDRELVPICDTGKRNFLYKQYRIFDVQMVNGSYVHALPLAERKRLLSDILIPSENVTIAPFYGVATVEELASAFRETVDSQGEGLMLKRLDETYMPDVRGWIKLKKLHLNDQKDEFDLYADRLLRDKNGVFGILECGYYEEDDAFVRVCSVSSGLSMRDRIKLKQMSNGGRFAPREMVVTIVADKITRNGHLRHPIFKRVRFDLLGSRLDVDARFVKRKNHTDI